MVRKAVTVELCLSDFFRLSFKDAFSCTLAWLWKDRAIEIVNDALEREDLPFRAVPVEDNPYQLKFLNILDGTWADISASPGHVFFECAEVEELLEREIIARLQEAYTAAHIQFECEVEEGEP